MLVFTIGDIGGILFTIWQDIRVPSWVWIIVFFLGFIIANFLSFHQTRIQRDEAREIMKESDRRGHLETYVEGKRSEWQHLRAERDTLAKPDVESIIQEARYRYVESNDIDYIRRVWVDRLELAGAEKEIRRFFGDIQKSIVSFRKNDTDTITLLNRYFGEDILYYYEKIGFFEAAEVEIWQQKGRHVEPLFQVLYEAIRRQVNQKGT